ncbi:PD-(D/E)XK motif protein [Roseovarius amoyensis]|uniref:PD-(D/E)XK motif protein n=1 Tax=Roseovarius amoyensis TaxID=2211448 RepID=UPI000DBE46C9|nr:PD-(D/E)XK motif protein [Roseovarius amoyensis]
MLFETYVKLLGDFPEGCDQLFGEPLSADGSLWLSVDGDAYPSLLFRSRRDDVRSDIELRSVSARFSRDCVIEAPDGHGTSGVYSVIRLNENDPDIVRMLLRLLEETFPKDRAPYVNKDIAAQILELANLFKQIASSDTDILGLWGELYILSQAPNIAHAVRCWCGHKMAKYDFVTRDFVLEAKTTLRSRRRHRFSLDQLRPSSDFSVYVASLALIELNSGRTAAELMDHVYANIDDDELRISFLKQSVLKGGQDIYRSTIKLNVFPDGTSLTIFNTASLPVPQVGDADPIENVRFDLDLTDLPSLPSGEAATILSFGDSYRRGRRF